MVAKSQEERGGKQAFACDFAESALLSILQSFACDFSKSILLCILQKILLILQN